MRSISRYCILQNIHVNNPIPIYSNTWWCSNIIFMYVCGCLWVCKYAFCIHRRVGNVTCSSYDNCTGIFGLDQSGGGNVYNKDLIVSIRSKKVVMLWYASPWSIVSLSPLDERSSPCEANLLCIELTASFRSQLPPSTIVMEFNNHRRSTKCIVSFVRKFRTDSKFEAEADRPTG